MLNGDGKKFKVQYLILNKFQNAIHLNTVIHLKKKCSLLFIGTRATTSPDSKIVFNIPVYAMNLNNIFTDVKRDIAISLYVGDSKMWFGFQEFIIKDADDSVLNPTTNDVSIASVSYLNSEPTPAMGDGVTYRVIVTVPSGWSDFNIVVEGTAGKELVNIEILRLHNKIIKSDIKSIKNKTKDLIFILDIKAANVEIVDTGTVAYFPPRSTVDEVDGAKLKINFGNVKNAAPDATNVTVDITYNLISFVGGLPEDTLKVTIGGIDVPLQSFYAVSVVSRKTIYMAKSTIFGHLHVKRLSSKYSSYYRRHLHH